MSRALSVLVAGCVIFSLGTLRATSQTSGQSPQAAGPTIPPKIPKTWDDAEMANLEVPLANPVGSPKHVSADYYYKLPVRPIYKSYPVYAPGREPAGYMDWLQRQEPQVIWDDAGHQPVLKEEADWIKAGEVVFDAPIGYEGVRALVTAAHLHNPDWWASVRPQVAKDGTLPGYSYVIRKKGEVDVGNLSCASCHDRVMPDGSVIKGAQGNFPFDRTLGFIFKTAPPQALGDILRGNYRLYGAPWLNPDPQGQLLQMSAQEIGAVHDAIPPGVLARHRASLFYPVQVPDLIGVKDRHYLDRTGLQQHRGIVDLMRYAALNQGGDDLANFDGFVPDGPPDFKTLPPPDKLDPMRTQPDRYSDEQLYALALYVYSLQPLPNPNKFDALAAHGQEIFHREGCVTCHTPPLYTNNKLTVADGFDVPADAYDKYDIDTVFVGTDTNLTLKTRRGTGYYKVPSLKGVWYRSMFGHSGWCATLEDWFDARRTQDDYVPTGFIPYGAKTYAVKGHRFGLRLSVEDKQALIAFLKTL